MLIVGRLQWSIIQLFAPEITLLLLTDLPLLQVLFLLDLLLLLLLPSDGVLLPQHPLQLQDVENRCLDSRQLCSE